MGWLQVFDKEAWGDFPSKLDLGAHEAGDNVDYTYRVRNPTQHTVDVELHVTTDQGDDIFTIEGPKTLGPLEEGRIRLRWTVGYEAVPVKPLIEMRETLHVAVGVG